MKLNLDYTVYKGHQTGRIVKSQGHKDDLAPDEVLLKITHAGVCGTDEHYKSADMVLGHEGVGIVEQVGEQVDTFKVGDRAGWGYLHNCCMHCEHCLSGNEMFCAQRAMYGEADLDQGAFASHAVWKATFLFHIPESISSAEAAPLMCAGSTVFNPLYTHVYSTDRVGVVGIGGLGHLAIQFASKMGCEVVVFSSTDSKKEEAMKLGATEFYATRGASKLEIGRRVDHLIITTSSLPDWNLLLPVVQPRGAIFPLTVSESDIILPTMAILGAGIRIQGSLPCSRGLHVKMLRFAALHGIRAVVEEFSMSVDGIEDAMARLEEGRIRYRAVLVA
ncbi:chaperonin 10-like protein [Butyriboletus roseoflavus]|nr:chaperonin 10-like protein [Butyriboletus roseoflavus]